jgi:glycosyltransferase involved in cell wall biosynthesis
VRPADVTVVILTLDEERNLPRALTSLPHGTDVFVLDAGSQDQTVQFAHGAGARVVQRAWNGYIDAREFALAQVRTPWTLMLDADEALDDVLREALVTASGDGVDGYRVKRTTYFCGKPMRLWRNESLLRLFRPQGARLEAHPAAGGTAALHERWTSDGPVGDLPGTLLHFSYPDVAAYRVKYARYTDYEAEGIKGSPVAVMAAFVKAAIQFPWMLFAKGAFLDGWRGWYVAFYSAIYPLVVASKALRW